MLNFAFYRLMYYRDKLPYHDKNIMIIATVIKSLLHTTTQVSRLPLVNFFIPELKVWIPCSNLFEAGWYRAVLIWCTPFDFKNSSTSELVKMELLSVTSTSEYQK